MRTIEPAAAQGKMATMKAIGLMLVLLICRGNCRAQDSSPSFHHDNQRTGRTTNRGPSLPRVRWSVHTGSSIEASPLISPDGTVYAASTDGHIYAFSPRGIRLWTFEAKDSIFATPAIGPDGALLAADMSGWVHSIRSDGTLKWSQALAGEAPERRVTAAPAVADSGQSFVVSWNDCLYSFGPNGSLLWQFSFEGEGQISAAPALDLAGNVYVATHDPADKRSIGVYKFAPDSARVLWKFSEDLGNDRNRIISSPAIDATRGRLYVGAARENDGCLYALDIADGKKAFGCVLPKGVISSPAIGADGVVYIGCLDGKIYALDPAGGSVRWAFATGAEFILGSPTIDGAGRIYIGDSDGALHSITAGGQEIWRYPVGSAIASAPVIAGDGTVYITSFDSSLYAIGERNKRSIPR